MKKLLSTIAAFLILTTSVYAQTGWNTYGELSSGLANDDDLLVRDVSDTTMAATGTQKRLEISTLKTALGILDCDPDDSDCYQDFPINTTDAAAPSAGSLRLYSTNNKLWMRLNGGSAIEIATGTIPTASSLSVDDLITLSGRAEGSTTIADPNGDITATTIDGALTEFAAAIELNTAKTTNATHTGDATGSDALTIANDAVTMAKLDDDGNFTDWTGNWTFSTGTFTLANGATISDSKGLTFDESAADPDDADIQLSATDGVLKISAANGANNEDITIDLDGTSNKATISSSTGVTEINTALAFVSTGVVQGKINVIADADGRSITKDTETIGTLHLATGAGTWVLPDIDAADGTGHSVCVYSTGANAVVVDPNAEDKIRNNGTLLTAGYTLTSASEAGNFICFVVTDFSTDIAHWTTMGMSGTWTAQTE